MFSLRCSVVEDADVSFSFLFRSVNLVRHHKTCQAFAMKVINWRNLTTENQIQQVNVERAILTYTDSPYLVSMLCAFQTKKDLRIVMNYVAGK